MATPTIQPIGSPDGLGAIGVLGVIGAYARWTAVQFMVSTHFLVLSLLEVSLPPFMYQYYI